jgi:hypothetical protein
VTTLEVVPRLPPALANLTPREAEELACRSHLGVWTARKRGLDMAPIHWEWCELRMKHRRLAVIAPREHSKTETFTVNGVAWEAPQTPGLQVYVFAQTDEMAVKLVERVWTAVEETEPWMCEGKTASQSKRKLTFANGATVIAAGAGKGVRGEHPDIIIGDDVLSEAGCRSELQRSKTASWWKGTVGGMAHPGTVRKVRPDPDKGFVKRRFPPTRVFLVGTPFHEQDLLMSMKTNPIYRFYRYAAEFQPEDLVPGTLAVDVA